MRVVSKPSPPLAHADLWMSFFRDTEGNLLALSSEIARQG
jgi:hypothetical protein